MAARIDIPELDNPRREREAAELRLLAPYAVASRNSRGRRFPEPPHRVRLCFERDRDRVIHSRCFRRLEYKAQVFVNGAADHYRTRLTHTMEMAAVARTLARHFRVNEDLTEAIVLAHDVGHTPFGHCGEFTLDAAMRPYGGFDHNRQSLRWVDLLEAQYPDFPGLNLSWEVRAGLMKHQASIPGTELDGMPIGPCQTIEAQIADQADDITYYAHDTDDAIEAGVLHDGLLETQPLWRLAMMQTRRQYIALTDEQFRRITVRNLLDVMVQDLMDTGRSRLREWAPATSDDVLSAPLKLMALSAEMDAMVQLFRTFLYREFYYTDAVQKGNQEGGAMIKRIFDHYVAHPECLGRKARNRIPTEGLHRTVCDYISGFTDRYVFQEVARYGLA